MKIFTEFKKLFTKGEKTTLQKQIRLGIILLGIIIIGLIVYFAIVAPAVAKKTTYEPVPYEGEEIYNGDTILMEKNRTRDTVVSIEVKNPVEQYKIIAKNPGSLSTSFYIEGSEDTAVNASNVSSLVVHSLMLVTNSPKLGSQDRVNDRATEADLASYGLDEASNPVKVHVELINAEESYTIVIGSKAPAGDGYYAIIEGRTISVDGKEYIVVYSLTTNIAGSFMTQTSAFLVNTLVLPYFSSGIYAPDNFHLERLSQETKEYYTIIKLHTLGENEGVSNQAFGLDYPKGYLVEENSLTSFVFSSLEYLSATEIKEYGAKVHDEEVYSKYGLDLDKDRLEAGTEKCVSRLTFYVKDITDNSNFEDGEYKLYFGNLFYNDGGVGYRYAYSPYSETIFTVPNATFEYVGWRTVNFISARVFYDYITSIDYIELIGKGTDVHYELTGNYLTYHIDVTKATDGSIVMRDGKPLTFDANPVIKKYGNYSTTEFEGEFENFRKLFYVLITREFSVDVDGSIGEISDNVSRQLNIKVTDRDQNQTFYRYDKSGNREYGNDGRPISAIYDGGYVTCRNVVVHSKGISGEETTLTYDVAYYDEESGKFFLKVEDKADGNFKPKNYKIGENGHLSGWTYLGGQIEAEYIVKEYMYNCYDVLYDYTDANGTVSKKVNQTYCFVVPTVKEYKYKINLDRTHELISEETTVSDGLYMRLAQIEKLFNDSQKLYDGIEIDKFGTN